MMNGKGNFSTCGPCNAAAYLLANKDRKLTAAERDTVHQFRYSFVVVIVVVGYNVVVASAAVLGSLLYSDAPI